MQVVATQEPETPAVVDSIAMDQVVDLKLFEMHLAVLWRTPGSRKRLTIVAEKHAQMVLMCPEDATLTIARPTMLVQRRQDR